MSAVRDGGPAFPTPNGDRDYPIAGKTLRDSFAEAALMGFCANNNETVEIDKAAEASFRIADAMLSARNRYDKVGYAAAQMLKALEAIKVAAGAGTNPLRGDIAEIAHEAIQQAKVAGVRVDEESKGEVGR